MPYLGDFIGHLMAELAIARVQADMESIRIAELYSGHELLRHFPVPRIRLPDVQIDLPFVNKTAAADTPGKHKFPSAKEISARYYTKAVEQLKSFGVELSPTRARTLKTRLMKKATQFEQPGGIPVNVGKLSSALAGETIGILNMREKEKIPPRDMKKHMLVLNKLIKRTSIEMQPPPSRLEVGVTTEEIREAGDAVTRIQLTLSEEGLEWTSIETDGQVVDRLIVE